jgi:deoxycytidine triphosphate deaminase
MIVNPKKLEKCIVPFVAENVQQNGIDLTLKSVSAIEDGSTIGVKDKDIRAASPKGATNEGYFYLDRMRVYEVEFNEHITVPPNMSAFIIHRSTLNRAGVEILSGWYDSGFSNQAGAVLRTWTSLRIQKNARIAQVIFFESEAAAQYKGEYQEKKVKKEVKKDDEQRGSTEAPGETH